MRRLKNLITIAGSCCLLWFVTGCGTETPVQEKKPVTDAKENINQAPGAGVDVANPGVVTLPPVTVPVPTPVVTPVIPLPPPPPPPFIGGGGGSQGAAEPARTGNPDKDPLELPETLCDDLVDNDDDGVIDCADPDCNLKQCDDENGCTIDDVCNQNECVGVPRNCEVEIGNECTIDVCETIEGVPNGFICVSSLNEESTDFGSCTPAGNCKHLNPDGSCKHVIDECLLGRCQEVRGEDTVSFVCVDAESEDIPTEDGGCNDGNPCTADACEFGECFYGQLDGVFCTDQNECTTRDICVLGECIGDDVPSTCTVDEECGEGFVCTSTPGTCVTDDVARIAVPGFPCFTADDCSPGEICDDAELGVCTCDDGNNCTEDTCLEGQCVGTPNNELECSDNNPCTTDTCILGVCDSDPVTNGTSCDDNIDCTTLDLCTDGDCEGTPDNEECEDDNACLECICVAEEGCDCDQITGPSDEECEIDLTEDLDLSETTVLALVALGIELDCEIGLIACVAGVEGACVLSDLFATTCDTATLDAACETSVFSLPVNETLAATLCAELEALVTP